MKKFFISLTICLSSFIYAQQVWSIEDCVDYAAKNNLTIQRNQLNEELSAKGLEQANKNRCGYVVSG